MQVLRDRQSITHLTNPTLRILIERCVQAILNGNDLSDDDLPGIVTILVVEPGDSLEAIAAQLGFSIIHNRRDDVPFGDPAFTPSFELVADHGDYFEIVFVIDDSGFGLEAFVPKHAGVPGPLLAMCAAFAIPAGTDT